MWPGFGENSRVLKWVFERCEGTAEAISTPIGNLPTADSIDFSGLDMTDETIAALLRVETDGWLEELPLIQGYYQQFADKLPTELNHQLNQMQQKLEAAKQSAS